VSNPTTSILGGEDRLEAAAAWNVRLAGDVADGDWLAFTTWLEADPANRQAFDRIESFVADVEDHKPALRAAYASPAVATSVPAWAIPRRWAAGAMALAAAVLVAVFVQYNFDGAAPVQVFATNVGEQRDVDIADGSVLHLNTNTAVSVTLEKHIRTVRLEKGEALFDVAADAQRPFDVLVGSERVHVVGTAFNILKHDGKVAVTVLRGVVQVSHSADKPADNTAVRLTVGDQFVRHEGANEYQLAKVDPSQALAWRDGRLIFEDAPLSAVASSLNRYFGKAIVINDAALQDLRFSGVLKIDDEANVLRRLEAFLPVVVQDRGNTVVLEGKAKE